MSTIQHFFKYKSHDLVGLFKGVRTMRALNGRIKKQAELKPDDYDPNDYKGDAFEFFIELLVTLLPNNRMMGGLHNYEPVLYDDNGIDAMAVNWEGKPSAVQIKYRSNRDFALTGSGDHLGNMVKEAAIKHRILPPEDIQKETPVFYVFTTAESLHHYTKDQFFHGAVHCVGWKELKLLVDNNTGFWEDVERIVKELSNERA